MDGRGRCQDNIFIERLWWTIKHHYLYLHSFDCGSDLRQGLKDWIRYYNQEMSRFSIIDGPNIPIIDDSEFRSGRLLR
jgi:putative transposase